MRSHYRGLDQPNWELLILSGKTIPTTHFLRNRGMTCSAGGGRSWTSSASGIELQLPVSEPATWKPLPRPSMHEACQKLAQSKGSRPWHSRLGGLNDGESDFRCEGGSLTKPPSSSRVEVRIQGGANSGPRRACIKLC